GFVWMATQDGLNRYDGKNFLVLDRSFDDKTLFTSARLGKVVPGHNHFLWLITEGGKLEKLNLLNFVFAPIALLLNDRAISSKINCVYEDAMGKLWIGTEDEGLLAYDVATGKVIKQMATPATTEKKNQPVNALYEDQEHKLWVIGNANVMSIEGNGLIVHHVVNKPGSVGSEARYFSGIDEDKEGTLWLGTFGQGLFSKRKGDAYFAPVTGFKTSKLPADLIIEAVLADDNNRIWIGTYGKGLFVMDRNLGQINHLKNDKKNTSSISYNDILTIKKDHTNGIWIGTDGGGVSYYNDKLNNFISFTNNNLAENIEIAQVRSVVTDKAGEIWAGTSNNGLTLLSKNTERDTTFKFKLYTSSYANVNRIVSLSADDEGDLWVGTQGNGLLLFDPNKKRVIKHFYPQSKMFNLPDYTIWCIYPKSSTQVWIGTQNAGLCLVDKEKGIFKNYVYTPNNPASILDNNVRSITAIDTNVLCIAFERKGIQLFDIRKEAFYHFKNNFLDSFFKTEPTIKSVFYSRPFLWIGTQSKGLIAVNIISGMVTHLTEKNGLPNNTVYGALQDGLGNIWISTNKGICRFDPGISGDKITPSGFINFTAADGLQSNEFNTGAYYKSPDGNIYFGGINGLTMFSPDKFVGSHEKADVVFTNILVDNEPLSNDTLPAYNKTLDLSYKVKSIAFNFAALDYPLSHQQNYYYRLEGYDKEWVQAGERNYAEYTNLPPGSYLFKVKASRYISSANDSIAALTIIIKPPFWVTWWFITLVVILMLLLLYAIYQYRIHQLLKLQKVRNAIAADLHDDVGSSLTNISILSELTRQSLPQPANAQVFLERIIEEVGNSNQALDDIIWSVNAKDNSIEDLLARMRRYAAELFDAGQVGYTLGFEEELSNLTLEMEQRRDLYLIFKEAMNNISKHAAPSYVSVYLKRIQNKLLLEIKDDGSGFDTSQETNRNGLKNIETRAKKWKGSVSINSASGKGTVVKVSLQVK
ncbi:MAG: histidine kinase, partial [Bacteroidota bacterium]|nr:histidine kinase [Bacteroidota bacterium]